MLSDFIDNFYFELIPTRVNLFATNPANKPILLGSILPILLNDDFFHISQHESELSLILPTKYKENIQKHCALNTMPETFAVLRIYQEMHGINEQGIVAKISKLFAQKDIPILYLNSFNNNFVLLPEERLDDLHDFIHV